MSNIARDSELEAACAWADETFLLSADAGDVRRFPLSFEHGDGKGPSATWSVHREAPSFEPGVEHRSVVLNDPETGLECRCEVKRYTDYPAVEWVAHLRNSGEVDTPILSDIRPLDVLFPLDREASCRVHHARGALSQRDDFEPLETPLTFRQGGSTLELAARTGKPSTLSLPFFNIEMGDGGVIGGIGWTGGWSAAFRRSRDGVRVRAGMERTHLKLHPGEEIRTPRILLLFWQGSEEADRVRGHNMLRRLILQHYTPHPLGQILEPPFCEGTWGAQPVASHLAKIEWLQDNDIPVECYWIDAAWYGDRTVEDAPDGQAAGWMEHVGSWSPNPAYYPQGLKPIGEAAAAAGMGFLLWMEPERAYQGTELTRQHPEWLLGPVRSGYLDGDNYMLNLGIPDARRHIVDRVSELISEAKITCYRQDFNDLRVPEIFAQADEPDRIGMTEIRHMEGLYAFWDELLERHPGLIIDNCAGGGQRIDLETMSRSVPLWRSDLQCWPFDPLSMQTQTQGLAPWVPLSTAVCPAPSTYAFRSALGPGMVTHWSTKVLDGGFDLPLEEIRELMAEAIAMRKYFYGDFYPLISFSLAADAWAAWQYDRPDLGQGMVVAFRRHASPFPCWQARLRALDPQAEYELTSHDDHSTRRMTGKSLMAEGFAVTLEEKPGSVLFVYRRAS